MPKKKKTKRNGREKTNKKRQRRCEIVAKNKELKRIKKSKKDKKDEKEMWARLKELNCNFAKVKEEKKKFIIALFCLGFVYFNTINGKLILIENIFACK